MCNKNASGRKNAMESHATTSARAADTTRTRTSFVIVILAMLLAACAGPFPLTQGGEDTLQVQASPPPAPEPVRKRRVQARDVLAEWGTFGIEPRSLRKSRAHAAPRPQALLALPEHTESIQEIVDNATCHLCAEKPYHPIVVDASVKHGVPPSLIHAVIQKESGYNPKARSKRNARGLMQVTPATARFVGVRDIQSLFDPRTNIHAGTAYLKHLMRTHTTFNEVLAAYNSGPGNVRKYKGVPPFKETRRYVREVRKIYAAAAGGEP